MATTFVANSTPQALGTSVAVAYPTLAAGDLLLILAASDSSTIDSTAAVAAGFRAMTAVTGGGATVRGWWKTASGSESGTVTVTTSGGTIGVVTMASYRPDSGLVLVPQSEAGAADVDSTSTAWSVTGSSISAAAADLLVFWMLLVATGGTFSSGASSLNGNHTAAGTSAARATARTASNLLQYVLRDRIFSGSGTGSPTSTGTAAGANVSGPAMMTLFRPTTPVTVSAGSDATTTSPTYALNATASNGAGTKTYAWSVTSGPSTSSAQFSSTSAEDPTFTFGGGAGVYVLQVQVSDLTGTHTDTVSITFDGGVVDPPVLDAQPDEPLPRYYPVTRTATPGEGGSLTFALSHVSGADNSAGVIDGGDVWLVPMDEAAAVYGREVTESPSGASASDEVTIPPLAATPTGLLRRIWTGTEWAP